MEEKFNMTTLSTFEDIFNKLIVEYQNQQVTVLTKQNGIPIANFQTTIENIIIQPLEENSSGNKIGLMVVNEKNNKNNFNIPFTLGFNTMEGIFIKDGAIIKTLDIEIIIRKRSKKKLA